MSAVAAEEALAREDALVRVEELTVRFPAEGGHRTVVDDVSFEVHAGEVLGIVGESGSGKSITSLSLLNLVDDPGEIVSGRVLLDGADVLKMRGTALQRVRGAEIGMIFQEPMRSLNPVFTIGKQLIETIRAHEDVKPADAYDRSVDWLRRVGLPNPERVMRSYPHEMSGGMLQRAMIAVALCCRPRLLIADEPTTALDVTIQAQIIDLLLDLRDETGMAMLFITHDLGVIAEVADSVLVMYGGHVVERGDVFSLFDHPQHPYTDALLKARPMPGQRLDRLPTISDAVRRIAAAGVTA
ncbi:ABC transporter ATP-binding protein [Microbacterium arabinogalactanolyticum]|uniref:ABC transporter ATP-binding protein n=1 Tax=Microbacterium arabinogalactanolyticum TaxID=69365 RepID=UPI002553EEA0|nr:ABC transporter ATP-binding protein [Microbacterium arabinogalactanolyticum]GLC85478.1 ABC transporter ATP-binding protein [Microbacterium arabinogalactanolyticum]